MVTGEIQGARIRLIDHLRELGVGSAPLRVSVEVLRAHAYPQSQAAVGEYLHTPIHDVHIVLRFFERAEPALSSGPVSEALFHQLGEEPGPGLPARFDSAEPDSAEPGARLIS
jgi:hypothetical protein